MEQWRRLVALHVCVRNLTNELAATILCTAPSTHKYTDVLSVYCQRIHRHRTTHAHAHARTHAHTPNTEIPNISHQRCRYTDKVRERYFLKNENVVNAAPVFFSKIEREKKAATFN